MQIRYNTPLRRHYFVFNKHDNGGEHFALETMIVSNGDPDGYFFEQKLRLSSYCNEAVINLQGASITPESLRQLADELDQQVNLAKEILSKGILSDTV